VAGTRLQPVAVADLHVRHAGTGVADRLGGSDSSMFMWNMSATTCTLRQPVTEAEPIVSAQFDAVEAVLLAELPLLEERVTRDVLFLARESHRRWSPCRLSVPTVVTAVPPQAPPVTVDPVHLGLLTAENNLHADRE
jgi:hypothetical protein